MKILIDYLIIIIKINIDSIISKLEVETGFPCIPTILRKRGEGVLVQKAWVFDDRKELKQMETFWAVHVYWKWGLFPFNMLDNNQIWIAAKYSSWDDLTGGLDKPTSQECKKTTSCNLLTCVPWKALSQSSLLGMAFMVGAYLWEGASFLEHGCL